MTAPEPIAIDGASALIYRTASDWDGLNTLAIGSIEIETTEAGTALLHRIATLAQEEGFAALLGPLDGDTWHSYRVVVESDGTPPFLLEPVSGPNDLAAFEAAGFEQVSQYISAIASLKDTLGETRPAVDGVIIEPWDGKDGEALIRHLFEMSGATFARNRFFTPIAFESFLDIYKPMMPHIDPRHVLFARDETGSLCGFLFGTPDLADTTGKPAAILKTYASGLRGVGHLLADTYHRRAIDMGFDKVIHALIHVDNTSLDRSERHGARVFRRYALMGRKI